MTENMRRFDRIKTIQMGILIVLAGIALVVIFTDRSLYHLIASDPHVRRICLIFWIAMAVSFVCLFYDFHSFAGLRRENMELDHAVYADALTGINNRYSVDVYLGQFLNRPLPPDMGCITIEIVNLSEINANEGHAGGDAAILSFSEVLADAAAGVCFIGRNGGNKFVAIFRDCSRRRLDGFLERIGKGLEEENARRAGTPVKISTGVAFEEDGQVHSLTALVALSDRRAWEAAQP